LWVGIEEHAISQKDIEGRFVAAPQCHDLDSAPDEQTNLADQQPDLVAALHAEAMSIWVDADACPAVIREILFRAAKRTGVQLTLVANQAINTPASPNIKALQVAQGFDVADNEIVRRTQADDLVITSDIPLAAEVIEKGGHALSPRGELYTAENIRSRLNMRDFLDTMRSSGVEIGGGPAAFSQRDKQQFANKLDQYLAKHNA
jgi:uncharacterized protein YaiI (UPF0178 family)